MFCTECGSRSDDGDSFCADCGSRLDALSQSVSLPIRGSQGPWTTARSQGKIPLVAAVLNFFFGLGYLYLGYKRVLGVPTIVFVIVAIILYFVFDISTDGIMTFILAASLAIDGWQKGRADYHSGTTFVPRS